MNKLVFIDPNNGASPEARQTEKGGNHMTHNDIPRPFRDGFTEEQMRILREYAQTVLARDAAPETPTIDTDALYGDDIDAALRELARVVYTVAVHHDVPYVTVWGRNADEGVCTGSAHVQDRNGEYSETQRYTPGETPCAER